MASYLSFSTFRARREIAEAHCELSGMLEASIMHSSPGVKRNFCFRFGRPEIKCAKRANKVVFYTSDDDRDFSRSDLALRYGSFIVRTPRLLLLSHRNNPPLRTAKVVIFATLCKQVSQRASRLFIARFAQPSNGTTLTGSPGSPRLASILQGDG
jgi:hypothetical protein